MAHTVICLFWAVLLSLALWLVGVGDPLVIGAVIATWGYLFRELDEILRDTVARKPVRPKWVDHVMDVAVPGAVVLFVAAVLS